jgi:hypothetical protein
MSLPLAKKAGKANKAHAQTDSSPPISQPGRSTATDEAYDVSGLEAQILKAIEKLTHDLSQLRGGGKLNPEVVESLKVQLGTTSQGKETVRLGDIAQVVPRGRILNVVCGEEAVRAPPALRESDAVLTVPPAHQTHHFSHSRFASFPHSLAPRLVQPSHHTSSTAAANRRVAPRRRRVGHQSLREGRQMDTDSTTGTQQAAEEIRVE